MSSNKKNTRTKILDATWKLMEERRGLGVRMGDIAKAAGVSRQAIYLHFDTRTALMSATAIYVDEVKGLDVRLQTVLAAKTAVEALGLYVEVWGNYVPEIYGLAKALLAARDTDEAAAVAWDERMACLRDGCRAIISGLAEEGKLAPEWDPADATEMLWTMLSFQTWEQLTEGCEWSVDKYVRWMTTLVMRSFVEDPAR
ncbi:MAG: TetR/AcrR family transcriptional regulator [Amylibacter sp.]|nr:TetR/AcrR family transcriptional regulator [Amylibacter sp.]